jgi:hypothetical protein
MQRDARRQPRGGAAERSWTWTISIVLTLPTVLSLRISLSFKLRPVLSE